MCALSCAEDIDGRREALMTRAEFISLIGQDVVVDYPLFKELQLWSMKSFTYDQETDTITHNRLPLNVEVMIQRMGNPHKGNATHG